MQIKNIRWSVKDLNSRQGKIDPSPQYQRGPVWKLADKQLLIDSIIAGFDIPKIYLRKVDTHAYEYEVADGQQRLRAIWEYCADGFSLSSSCSVSSCASKVYSDLTSLHRKKLNEFSLVVAVAYKATSSEIRELFVRLQRGMTLTPPEIRNAISSQLGDIIRMIGANNAFFKNSPFPAERFKHDDLAAHAFLMELSEKKTDLKAPELKKMYSDFAAGIDDTIKQHVAVVLDLMNQMQTHRSGCISRKWGFVDVFGVISEMIKRKQSTDAKVLASKFVTFELRRLSYLSHPEDLISKPGSQSDRDLFKYIEAFKTSAGLADNVKERHRILASVFSAAAKN